MPQTLTPSSGLLSFTETVKDGDGSSLSISVELDQIDGTDQSGSDRSPTWLSFTTQSALADGVRTVDVSVEIDTAGVQTGSVYTFVAKADDGTSVQARTFDLDVNERIKDGTIVLSNFEGNRSLTIYDSGGLAVGSSSSIGSGDYDLAALSTGYGGTRIGLTSGSSTPTSYLLDLSGSVVASKSFSTLTMEGARHAVAGTAQGMYFISQDNSTGNIVLREAAKDGTFSEVFSVSDRLGVTGSVTGSHGFDVAEGLATNGLAFLVMTVSYDPTTPYRFALGSSPTLTQYSNAPTADEDSIHWHGGLSYDPTTDNLYAHYQTGEGTGSTLKHQLEVYESPQSTTSTISRACDLNSIIGTGSECRMTSLLNGNLAFHTVKQDETGMVEGPGTYVVDPVAGELLEYIPFGGTGDVAAIY